MAARICSLASNCEYADRNSLLLELRTLPGFSKLPFSVVEKQLAAIQKAYNANIENLKKLPEKEKRLVYSAITVQLDVHRCNAFLVLIEDQIKTTNREISARHDQINDLQHRLENQSGHRTQLKDRREDLLNENNKAREFLRKIKALYEKTSKQEKAVTKKAKEAKSELKQKATHLNFTTFAYFEKQILMRELIKARFFLQNCQFDLYLNFNVQNAFDRILGKIAPPPPSLWEQICCCFIH